MSGEQRNNDLMRPQSPEVYRRRRIVALVLLVLVVALVVGLVGWIASLFRPGPEEPPAGPATSAAAPASPTESPAESPSAPGDTESASPGEEGPPSESPSPTGSGSESGTPSEASPSGEPSDEESADPAGVACQPGDLVISAATDQQSYPEGQDPVLELRVDNTGEEPCETNLGTSQQVFTVYSGSDRIFSTQDCQVEGEDAMMAISPDGQERSRFTWPRVRSVPGCAEVESAPRAGTYRLEVALGDLEAQPVTFTLQ